MKSITILLLILQKFYIAPTIKYISDNRIIPRFFAALSDILHKTGILIQEPVKVHAILITGEDVFGD